MFLRDPASWSWKLYLQPPSTMAASQPDVEHICKVQFPCVNLGCSPPQMPVTTRIIFIFTREMPLFITATGVGAQCIMNG